MHVLQDYHEATFPQPWLLILSLFVTLYLVFGRVNRFIKVALLHKEESFKWLKDLKYEMCLRDKMFYTNNTSQTGSKLGQ